MDQKYDYTVVGCGPTGLATGWILAKYGKRVLLLDSEDTIGGCHRVRRVDGYFSEHGPRIYFDAYLNTIRLLDDMGLRFGKYFTKYNFSIGTIGGEGITDMEFRELFWFGVAYFKMMLNPKSAQSVTCQQFMEEHSFSSKTMDYIDRVCRLTDGAGMDKYTLFEILQSVDQHAFYTILQPNRPTDLGLFADVYKVMNDDPNIDFMLGTKVTGLVDDGNKVTNLFVEKGGFQGLIGAKGCIMAIPPMNLMKILKNSSDLIKNSFGDFDTLYKWVDHNSYNVYINIVYHWDKKMDLPKIWGFPKTEWGVAFVVLSDYMEFDHPNSKTVISCCTTYEDRVSSNNGKIIHQCDEEELINEVFNQLKLSFPDLPKPTKSVVSPGVYRDTNENKWKMLEDEYMMTTDVADIGHPIPLESPIIKNLFSVGTHSGKHKYNFTSFESAVSNGFALANYIIPTSETRFPIKEPTGLQFVIKIVLLIVVLVIIYFFFRNSIRYTIWYTV